MYITAQSIITVGGIITAAGTIITLFWQIFRWIDRLKAQEIQIGRVENKFDREILNLHSRFDKERAIIGEEQALVVYGLLACLKGLAEQGCDGPVAEAIAKIEKHINIKAHSQN